MTLPAALIAVIRTGVQLLVGWALSAAWVVAILDWLADNAGVEVSRETIENTALAAATLGVVWLVNWAGKRWEWVNRLFSLGTSSSAAVYEKTALTGGGGPEPETSVDTGGEDMGIDSSEHGAVSVGVILALVAGVCAVAFFFTQNAVLLAVGLLCVAVAHLAGGQQVG